MPADEVGVRARIVGARKFLVESEAMRRAIKRVGDEANSSDVKFMGLNARVTFLRNIMGAIKPVALIAGLGLAAQGASGLTAAIVALTGALAPLSGAIVALPAGLSAVAQGMVAWKLATGGLTDAVGGLHQVMDEKKLGALSIEAQGAARALDRMKRPVIGIQRATQRGLFPGMEKGLREVRPVLSDLRDEFGLTGQVMGTILASAGRMASSGPFSRDLQDQMRANATWMGLMGGAGLNLAHALMDVLVSARPLVDWMMRLVASWSVGVREWAAMGRESGRLTASFERTRRTLVHVFSIVGALAQTFKALFKASRPLGDSILGDLDKGAESLARWSNSTKGQNTLRAYFAQAKPMVYELGRLIRDVTKAFFDLGNQPGGAALVRQFRTQVLPALVEVTRTVTASFSPALMDGIVALAQLAVALSGTTGPLTLTVEGLTQIAKGLTWVIQNVPGASGVFTGLAVAVAGLKLMGLVAAPFKAMAPLITAAKWAMVAFSKTTVGTRIGLALLTAQEWLAAAGATAIWAAITAPVVLVVAAIAAVAAGFVLLYRKCDWFRHLVDGLWSGIKSGAQAAAQWIKTAIGDAVDFITRKVQWILDKLKAIPGIAKTAADIALPGGKHGVGSKDGLLGIPGIPGLATGGTITSGGATLVGERGPELLNLPVGASVHPMPRVNAAKAKPLPDLTGALAGVAGLTGDLNVTAPIYMDGRKVAEGVARVARDRTNRK